MSELLAFEMHQISMAPTLMPGDILLVEKDISSHFIARGDIILFKELSQKTIWTAHRVIGFNAKGFPWIVKGDRNIRTDSPSPSAVFGGKVICRVRSGKAKQIRFKRLFWILNRYNLFPEQAPKANHQQQAICVR